MEILGSCGVFVGGASGMCRATAMKFAEKGGKVAILDLEQSDGAKVAESLGGVFQPCNVMDYEGMEASIDAAVAALGGMHFMVNTAGGGVAQRTIKKDGTRHALEDFRRIIDLNLIASFNINSIAAQHMAKNEPNENGERGGHDQYRLDCCVRRSDWSSRLYRCKRGNCSHDPNHGS
jgi:NAD(P)-dependent dehydrogenase (short-subunit alcohol dehydrogenase family)